MTRRLPAPLALLAAVAILAARPAPTRADGLTTFRITDNGNAPIDQVVNLLVSPSGMIDPTPNSDGSSWLKILGGSGFDSSKFIAAVGQNADKNQVLGLGFGYQKGTDPGGNSVFTPLTDANGAHLGMLQPGGSADFSVKTSPSFQGPLQLQLSPDEQNLGLSITALSAGNGTDGSPTGGNGSPTPDPATNTPEPISLTLWSGLAALGLLRARAYRRAHRRLA